MSQCENQDTKESGSQLTEITERGEVQKLTHIQLQSKFFAFVKACTMDKLSLVGFFFFKPVVVNCICTLQHYPTLAKKHVCF